MIFFAGHEWGRSCLVKWGEKGKKGGGGGSLAVRSYITICGVSPAATVRPRHFHLSMPMKRDGVC